MQPQAPFVAFNPCPKPGEQFITSAAVAFMLKPTAAHSTCFEVAVGSLSETATLVHLGLQFTVNDVGGAHPPSAALQPKSVHSPHCRIATKAWATTSRQFSSARSFSR
jgi:hypothetical protein